MMEREVHITARDLLNFLQFKDGDFGEIAIVSGQPQRAKMILEKLERPKKNFTFLTYTFWTGFYKEKRVTVGNAGFYAPDSAFLTEMLCEGGVEVLIRVGSCGALKREIKIGDFIIVDKVLRGDGVTKYYVDEDFSPILDKELMQNLKLIFERVGNVYVGGVWTTDALLREKKEIVNSYIEKGAIGVDMVSSPFVVVSNLYKKRVGVVLIVSDNLISGEFGFKDNRFFEAQKKAAENILKIVELI